MSRFLVALLGIATLVAVPALAQDSRPRLPQTAQAPEKPPAAKPAVKTPTAVITLEKGGEIVLEFWPQDAPKHVENFVKLANEKFYDGQRVHRVEPNFVVQFGDPQSKTLPMDHPKMGSGGPGYTIKAEFNKRPFERGVLGMARTSEPDSAGSQIYIMLGPAPFLNGKYTAFGKVATGMGVVDQIKVGDRIKSVKIITQ
jgi:peptidyl-prolyl cis-trans isomerase B (cyclophilin B)